MKFFIIILFLTSIVNSQYYNGLQGAHITLSDNVGYVRSGNGGSSAVNSIIISGDTVDQNQPRNDLNTVRLGGQNGSGGPLNIALRNNKGVIENSPTGSNGNTNYNQYPQNNVQTNRRPENFPTNQQIRAPASLRPSFQYPGIRNSLNNGNDYLKNFIPGAGGLALPYPFLWG